MAQRHCPTPSKKRFSEAEAIANAISLSRRMGIGIRHYRCPCGWWHITKRPRWEPKLVDRSDIG